MPDETQVRRLIARKRDGAALAPEEWAALVAGFCAGGVDEAQMAALAMACVLRGMNLEETVALTAAMVASGETLQFPPGVRCIDKHSTGGVGDTVSLIVVPLAAACGVRVAKLSGRALGHTGGTLDKLAAIPGCRIELEPAQFMRLVLSTGCAIAAQSAKLVPADKRLYALRDRTATVNSVGLIAASIVSKKIAGGAAAFVFDVKCGRGSFLPGLEQARELAQMLVDVSSALGKTASALITDMEGPLGPAIGSGLETIEAREFLRGTRRDPRLREVTLALADEMLALGGAQGGRGAVDAALASGAAYDVFCRMIAGQGAAPAALEALRVHPVCVDVPAPRSGIITAIDPVALGERARDCVESAGPQAGIVIRAGVGAAIERGAPLATVYGVAADDAVAAAFVIGAQAPPARPLVHGIVRSR